MNTVSVTDFFYAYTNVPTTFLKKILYVYQLKISQLVIPSCGKVLVLLSISPELCMIWSYPSQYPYSSVVIAVIAVIAVITYVVVDEDIVFNRFSHKMFFQIASKCRVDGGISQHIW